MEPTQGANAPFNPINIDPGTNPFLKSFWSLTSNIVVLSFCIKFLKSSIDIDFKLFSKIESKSS